MARKPSSDVYRPRYVQGGRALVEWMRRPASERGVASAFEAVFSLTGPMIEREFRRFSEHPVGARLLKERPSLLDEIADLDKLGAMPEGSFGRAYADFMRRMNVSDARSFAALANVEELGRKLGWDEGVAYFVERQSHSHDLFHVLSGYGSDVAGEGAVIWFTYGQFRLPVLWGILGVLALLRPKIGWQRWHRYLYQAYERGRDASPLTCTDYERLFPMQLDDVRRELGIAPAEQAHPREGIVVDYMFSPPEKGLSKKRAAA